MQLGVLGFNACLRPNSDSEAGQWKALVRRIRYYGRQGVYPEGVNELFVAGIVEDRGHWKVSDAHKVKDTESRPRHVNYTSGFEDARWLGPYSALAVTLDTNSEFRCEMSYLEFDENLQEVRVVRPLRIEGIASRTEKNWLPLEVEDRERALFLYSCAPLRVAQVNLATGLGRIVYEGPGLPDGIVAHNGAVLTLPEHYLVTVRIKDGYRYVSSRWLLIEKNGYKVVGISAPSRLMPGDAYEMCMSLHLDGGVVTACVSEGDRDIFILQYRLEELLRACLDGTVVPSVGAVGEQA